MYTYLGLDIYVNICAHTCMYIHTYMHTLNTYYLPQVGQALTYLGLDPDMHFEVCAPRSLSRSLSPLSPLSLSPSLSLSLSFSLSPLSLPSLAPPPLFFSPLSLSPLFPSLYLFLYLFSISISISISMCVRACMRARSHVDKSGCMTQEHMVPHSPYTGQRHSWSTPAGRLRSAANPNLALPGPSPGVWRHGLLGRGSLTRAPTAPSPTSLSRTVDVDSRGQMTYRGVRRLGKWCWCTCLANGRLSAAA